MISDDGSIGGHCFGLLTFRKIRRVASSILNNQRSTSSEVGKCRVVVPVGLHFPQYRLYSHFVFSRRGHAPFTGFGTRNSICKHGYSKNFSAVSASNVAAHHAQVAWRRLYEIFSCNGKTFPPVGRIAQAVSLALSRSHLVVPGMFAFTFGELALAQRPLEYTDHYPSRNTLYMRAQDGHAYVTSLLFSVFEGVVLFLRALYLAILFSPCIVMAPFADSFGHRFRNLWLQVVHGTLEKAELHTKAPEHSFAYTKKTIEKAFGRNLSEIFEDFEELPVASGSIAQVHRASLKFRYPGQQVKPVVVAVKVRHPGVGESIRRDFLIINLVAKISNFIPTLRWLRLDESVQQFAVFMMSQVDLAREAAHLSRFIYNFRRWKDVSFPKPVYPLVHPAVLVESYEHGESVSHYVDDLEGQKRIKSALAHIGTHALLKMLLVMYFTFYFG
ncbi:putative serine/threonine-protein kinase abkC [Vitis vinifera]|uniref:Putative serine/threonine-protein kinase abkC n=1 Tax=Vitis vinifera TaxID=29760 RepID=A0A438CYL8_VITVI|nr:putative serine/threonine-protein kinase abkC [Vitis vinifera]